MNNEIKEMAAAIGQFYLTKHNGDYQKAEHEIRQLNIVDIQLDVAKGILPLPVIITAGRVGLLVGRRGTNIEALEKYLNRKVRIIEAQDTILEYLIPRHPDDY